jgi:PRTRC genetic system ThiF family protein
MKSMKIALPAPAEISLDRLAARKVIVPLVTKTRLVLIGCGGTGSWLAPSVARFARTLAEKFSKEVVVCFVDPDVVEAKNIYRQNFCRAEVGYNKAVTLAKRFSTAWSVNIFACPQKYSWQLVSNLGGYHFDGLTVLIGCVDSREARRDIQGSVHNIDGAVFWLDCGNTKESGQVLLGRNPPGEGISTFPTEGKCAWLPLPSRQHKDLVAKKEPGTGRKKKPAVTEGLSCAEIALLDEQGLTINQSIAAIAADYLKRLLLTEDLDRFQTYIDLASGSMKSMYITPANLRQWRRG